MTAPIVYNCRYMTLGMTAPIVYNFRHNSLYYTTLGMTAFGLFSKVATDTN